MEIGSFVIGQVCLFAWREGERLCPGAYDAKLAIAHIIGNRVKSGWHSGDWLQVLENVPLHSASEPSEILTFDHPDLWNPEWIKLMQDCRGIYEGTLKDDLTWTPSMVAIAENAPGGDVPINRSRPSFFYANLQMPIRPWFMEKIITQRADHPLTVTIASSLVLFG